MSKHKLPEDKCSKHKKEVAGISDMKVLAEMIGDLHYESFADFLKHLEEKIGNDGLRDIEHGKPQLGNRLCWIAGDLHNAYKLAEKLWQISKPFMKENNL